MRSATVRMAANGGEGGRLAEPGPELGQRLQGYFNRTLCSPLPDRLERLADALEAALERGELRRGAGRS